MWERKEEKFMASIQLQYHSDILGMEMSAQVILPQHNTTQIGMESYAEEQFTTLWLLHGLSDDHTTWHRRTAIERYASERGIAVVCPNAHRSWYCDMKYGGRFFTHLTEELPRICRSFFRGMSADREHNIIAGLSMGGYGALKCALTYPDRYRAAASLSGSVDIVSKVAGKREEDAPEWYAVLGEFDRVKGSKNDLFHLADQIASTDTIPDLFLWCGTEDHLLDANRRFHAHLEDLNITHTYTESEGNHSWQWWDRHIVDALNFLL
jgi:S-formylglutathione hydrolase FrmB